MTQKKIITRFAPSPTGMLHIGSVRTALFNWLYARHHGGKFLLRIEDTDRARSTPEATQAILDGMRWMNLDWDDEVVYQSHQLERHKQVAAQLLAGGKAYKCFCTPEELQEMREKAKEEGRPSGYDGTWRDRDPSEVPAGTPFVVRLKSPQSGETSLKDLVQGEVRVDNTQLDDMILLRSDGTPTYMLSVVVDDHDMNVTHIIRGDDHLTNAFRQAHIYAALGWDQPIHAHIPLIHGPDGAKLSKRHGALGTQDYERMGFLPEAMENYLLRLGWSHGDDEIISRSQALEWFGVEGLGKSAARFDTVKLTHLNGHYLRHREDAELLALVMPFLPLEISQAARDNILKGMDGLKQRAKTLIELAESALVYVRLPEEYTDKAVKLMTEPNRVLVAEVRDLLNEQTEWTADALESFARDFADHRQIGLGMVAQPMRVALTGSTVSPSIFELMEILGKEDSLERINKTLSKIH